MALALAIGSVVQPPQGPEERPTLRASVAAVTIDAWAHDEQRAIGGLAAEDFIVRDNGVERLVDSVGTTNSAHVIVVVDVSGSVAGDVGSRLRAAIQRLLPLLTARDRMSLVTFGDRVRVHAVAEAPDRIDASVLSRLPDAGSTTVLDAILIGSQLGRADGRPAVLLLFTDGADTASWTSAGRVIDALERSSVVVYAVGAGVPDVMPSPAGSDYFRTSSWLAATPRDILGLLRLVADTTGGEVLRVDEQHSLDDVFLEILHRYRQRYLLSFVLPEATEKGWHRLDVRLRKRPGTVVARAGYVVP